MHPGTEEVLDRLLSSTDQTAPGPSASPSKAAAPPPQQGLFNSGELGRAAFLKNRPMQGPSASSNQFGLLGDASEADGGGVGGGGAGGEGKSGLFDKVAEVGAEKPRPKQADFEGVAITYNDFIGRLMRPESKDLAKLVRTFISSILGPNGDGSPPGRNQSVDYDFYGSHMLQRRCELFFKEMETKMSVHVSWKDLGEGGLTSARNNLEKYVMTKIYDIAMAGQANPEEDARLSHRMELLSFIPPEALEVNPNLRNEVSHVRQGGTKRIQRNEPIILITTNHQLINPGGMADCARRAAANARIQGAG